MSETKQVNLIGKAEWAKVYEGNRDRDERYFGDCDGACTIDLIVENEEYEKLAEAGSRTKPKADEEGLRLKFRRKWEHPSIPAFGGAPQVVIQDGDEVKPFDKLIGNGSLVEVAVTVYPTKMGNGTRLEGVKVLDWVEFKSEEGEGGGERRLPF